MSLECIQLGHDRGSSQLALQCFKQPLHVVLFKVKLMCRRLCFRAILAISFCKLPLGSGKAFPNDAGLQALDKLNYSLVDLRGSLLLGPMTATWKQQCPPEQR